MYIDLMAFVSIWDVSVSYDDVLGMYVHSWIMIDFGTYTYLSML